MAKDEKELLQEEAPVKPAWLQTKEAWYARVPLTLKQLDMIIGLAVAALVIVGILIALESYGIL